MKDMMMILVAIGLAIIGFIDGAKIKQLENDCIEFHGRIKALELDVRMLRIYVKGGAECGN